MSRFGIVCLQGDFAAHAAALRAAGAEVREVRRCADLEGLRGIVLPGGESTTLLNLMGDEPWFEALHRFHAQGGAIFGTCAGAILLAREVRPRQKSLALLDATVERNAYGRQVDSFETRLKIPDLGLEIDAVFIRAPRFRALGPKVEVLARIGDEAVLVRQGRILAAAFHPELSASTALHELFTQLPESGRPEHSRPARLVAANR